MLLLIASSTDLTVCASAHGSLGLHATWDSMEKNNSAAISMLHLCYKL